MSLSLTLASDFGGALGLSEAVGGLDGVGAGVGGLHLLDGDLVAAVGPGVAVDLDTGVLLQRSSVLQTVCGHKETKCVKSL